jgi:hypothetical protein
MGLDRTIRFVPNPLPSWEAIRGELARVGIAASLRMIDGLPAFPDERPDESWQELRVGFLAGMVTLRRGGDHLSCIVWGNADSSLKQSWDALCWACAAAGGGTIDTIDGPATAVEFGRSAGLFTA